MLQLLLFFIRSVWCHEETNLITYLQINTLNTHKWQTSSFTLNPHCCFSLGRQMFFCISRSVHLNFLGVNHRKVITEKRHIKKNKNKKKSFPIKMYFRLGSQNDMHIISVCPVQISVKSIAQRVGLLCCVWSEELLLFAEKKNEPPCYLLAAEQHTPSPPLACTSSEYYTPNITHKIPTSPHYSVSLTLSCYIYLLCTHTHSSAFKDSTVLVRAVQRG